MFMLLNIKMFLVIIEKGIKRLDIFYQNNDFNIDTNTLVANMTFSGIKP